MQCGNPLPDELETAKLKIRDECVKFVRLESSNKLCCSGYTNKGNCTSAKLHALIEIERGHRIRVDVRLGPLGRAPILDSFDSMTTFSSSKSRQMEEPCTMAHTKIFFIAQFP